MARVSPRNNSRRSPSYWWLGLGSFGVLLLGEWQLLFVTGTGIGVMALVYWMQNQQWQDYRNQLLRLWRGPNRQMATAAGSGAIATLASYLAVSLRHNPETAHLLAEYLLVSLSVVGVGAGVTWQLRQQQQNRKQQQYDRALDQLSAPQPMQRLVAIHKLREISNSLTPVQKYHLLSCLRFFLEIESEAAIRQAAMVSIESLAGLDQAPPLEIPLQPQTITVDLE
jgi:hypothetical protein